MHSHSSGWCNGDNPFLRQGNTGCAQEACQKLKMTVLVSTRETWGDAVPTHKVQTQSPGLFQWREFASWAVWKKEYKSMYWCKIINRGYRQKMFVFFFPWGKSWLFHSLFWYVTNLFLQDFLTRLPSVRKRSRYPAKALQISLRNVSNLSHPLKFFFVAAWTVAIKAIT